MNALATVNWMIIAEFCDIKTMVLVLSSLSKQTRSAVLAVAKQHLRTSKLGALLLAKLNDVRKPLLQLLFDVEYANPFLLAHNIDYRTQENLQKYFGLFTGSAKEIFAFMNSKFTLERATILYVSIHLSGVQ